jgi:Spy/CpxP family protein refolding chaperone
MAPEGGPWMGSPFGVRRPLRFLAAKLELDEVQVRRLAEILDALKTERAQAAVDDRRTLTAFAEALGGEAFDASRAAAGASLRTESTERVAQAVVGALEAIHALLQPDQRERFAYLIRAGVVAL